MSWEVLLADAANGAALGELRNAKARRLRFPLVPPKTVEFEVERDHGLLSYLLSADLTLVKAYDDKTLKFTGPISSFQKNAPGRLRPVAADPSVRLAGRLIGKQKTAGKYVGTSFASMDRGQMMWSVISEARSVWSAVATSVDSDHGIRQGTITASASAPGGPWYFRPALETLGEIAAPLDGPEWTIDPLEPTLDSSGLAIGSFRAAPVIGVQRSDAIFEYGTGRRNVASFTDSGDSSNLCNGAFSLPPGFPDQIASGDDVVFAGDTTSRAARGAWESVIAADLPVALLRTRLAQEHVEVRRFPRRVITFQPVAESSSGRVPQYGADYSEGDIVEFRAVEFGVVTVDALFRIYAVEIELDDLGLPTSQLTLVQEG